MAVGAVSDSIVFTSFKDDSYGTPSDTNNDGSVDQGDGGYPYGNISRDEPASGYPREQGGETTADRYPESKLQEN